MSEQETKIITLPVSKLEAVIQEGDGSTERVILKRGKKIYEVFPEYLAAMTTRIGDKTQITVQHILDLFAPDQEYIAVELSKLNYGDSWDFEFACGSCNKSSDQSYDLNKLDYREPPPEMGPDPTVDIILPKSKKRAVVGLLTGHKERILFEQAATSGIDLVQAAFQSLRSLGNQTDFSFRDVDKLKLRDLKEIRKLRKQLIFGYDTNINISCPYCDAAVSMNILLHKDFLLPAG